MLYSEMWRDDNRSLVGPAVSRQMNVFRKLLMSERVFIKLAFQIAPDAIGTKQAQQLKFHKIIGNNNRYALWGRSFQRAKLLYGEMLPPMLGRGFPDTISGYIPYTTFPP